mmetsp:Transcript_19687/g.46996  ORF Transcript_19687/g.46996 Transcript_19687/m.46996 type:complete len:208 (-) Transcript_19687:865-1488(-)
MVLWSTLQPSTPRPRSLHTYGRRCFLSNTPSLFSSCPTLSPFSPLSYKPSPLRLAKYLSSYRHCPQRRTPYSRCVRLRSGCMRLDGCVAFINSQRFATARLHWRCYVAIWVRHTTFSPSPSFCVWMSLGVRHWDSSCVSGPSQTWLLTSANYLISISPLSSCVTLCVLPALHDILVFAPHCWSCLGLSQARWEDTEPPQRHLTRPTN